MVFQLCMRGIMLLNERRDEVIDRFELMTVCPRQHKRDIIAQTSRLRVVRCHTQRFSQELSPGLLVTSENVSRHQLFGDIYEQLLRDLQSAGNAGEYYTPRAVTQFAV